jgi:D-glycero-D-manno-heptose 1,7-bisphosphate phosphatase
MGYLAVLISNQPGIAKGKFSIALLEAMTQQMHAALAEHGARLDGVYYCMHHPEGVVEEYSRACECRKPRPGMLIRAAQDLDIDLGQSYFIGDGITDVQAGQAGGVHTILVYPSLRCYICEELNRRQVKPGFIVRSLPEAVELVRTLNVSQAN